MVRQAHIDSDPIETSPNKNNQHDATYIEYDNPSDYDADSLFDEVDNEITPALNGATQPLKQHTGKLSQMISDDISSSPPASPPSTSQYITQPTQLLTTPPKSRENIEVPRSSPGLESQVEPPLSQYMTQPRLITSLMAPPGTIFNPPPVARLTQSQFDDTPIDISSDDEDELARSNASDIRKTKFTIAGKVANERPGTERKESSFGGLLGSYVHRPDPTAHGVKRPAVDDMASAYAGSSRPAKVRQTGPSRAMPVEQSDEPHDSTTIQLLLNYKVRANIKRILDVFPSAKMRECENAMIATKGNFEDALVMVQELLERREELEKQAQSKGVAQHTAKAVYFQPRKIQQKSIAERYGGANKPIAPASQRSSQTVQQQSQEIAQPRRRLKQGRKHREPSSSPAREIIDIDDNDSAVSALSEGDGDDSCDDDLLNIINNFSKEELVDLSEQSTSTIEIVIGNRPYKTLNAVRQLKAPGKGRGKARDVGERFVEVCENALTAFKAIDILANKCQKYGEPIAATMKQWGAGNEQGEIDLTTVGPANSRDSSAERDSGIGTPSSKSASSRRGRALEKEYFGKPKTMSGDVELKDYQLVGLNWLALLYKHKLSCILGDDMGLGKTCQVIAFLTHLAEKGVKGPHLIVVQSSTIENWMREFEKFSPSLNVLPYHGTQAERLEIQDNILDSIDEGALDAVVTTYNMTASNLDRSFLKKLHPNVIVYDEAQMLKNANSQRYLSLNRLRGQFRLLLTGTPVQNNLQELTALLGFLMPEEFNEHRDSLAYIFKHKAKTTDTDHAALLSDRRIQRARQMMAPFILRRKKHQVLKHLPTKTLRVVKCDMTGPQRAIYEQVLLEGTDDVTGDDTVAKLAEQAADENAKINEGKVLTRLRQAAAHPLLLQNGLFSEDDIVAMSHRAAGSADFARAKQDKLFFAWRDKFCDGSLMKLCYEHSATLGKWARPVDEALDGSGKVKKLVELLKRHKKNGDRTLVFSQWTSMLDILEIVLSEHGIIYRRLDGSTSVQDRQALIDEYNSKPEGLDVFMLSTKAGGTGVNLATANKVVIFDSGYNPQEDVQAGNRAHRVGQTRPVEVITLITEGTVEEKIWALGESKLKLDAEIAGEAVSGTTKDATAVGATGDANVGGGSGKQDVNGVKEMKNTKDIKDAFMDGLKSAGLDMSAAEDLKR